VLSASSVNSAPLRPASFDQSEHWPRTQSLSVGETFSRIEAGSGVRSVLSVTRLLTSLEESVTQPILWANLWNESLPGCWFLPRGKSRSAALQANPARFDGVTERIVDRCCRNRLRTPSAPVCKLIEPGPAGFHDLIRTIAKCPGEVSRQELSVSRHAIYALHGGPVGNDAVGSVPLECLEQLRTCAIREPFRFETGWRSKKEGFVHDAYESTGELLNPGV